MERERCKVALDMLTYKKSEYANTVSQINAARLTPTYVQSINVFGLCVYTCVHVSVCMRVHLFTL